MSKNQKCFSFFQTLSPKALPWTPVAPVIGSRHRACHVAVPPQILRARTTSSPLIVAFDWSEIMVSYNTADSAVNDKK